MYVEEGVRYSSRAYARSQAENLVSQEDFIKQKIQWNEAHKREGKPIEAGFVDVWSPVFCIALGIFWITVGELSIIVGRILQMKNSKCLFPSVRFIELAWKSTVYTRPNQLLPTWIIL